MRHFLRAKATLALCLALVALSSAPLFAQGRQVSLDQISAYLQDLQRVEARFDQVNPDGSRSAGSIKIQRPGQMRFDYEGRDQHLVVVSGGSINIFDARSRGEATVYPLNRTPLSLLLEGNIDLARAPGVMGLRVVNGMTVLQMRDHRNPDNGQLHMIFDRDPVRLHGWVLVDDMGQATRVTLRETRQVATFQPGTFSIDLARDQRRQNSR